MSSSMYNIEKLDDNNYEAWCIQMQSVLVCQDLWSVVSGELTKPVLIDDNAAEVTDWLKKDQKAKASIILSITPMQILHIKNTETAKAAWDALREIHKPKGPARKVTLFKTLLGMKMSETDNMQQHVCKFCAAADKLAEVGVEVQKESLVIMLLASLPKSYENLVVALESRDELPSLNSVKIKLIEEGDRRKEGEQDAKAEVSVQAYMLRNNRKNSANNYKKETNKRQHKCYNCGRKGHYAAQCRETKYNNNNRNNSGNSNNNDNNEHGLFAAVGNGLFATVNNILHENAWCVDSGATSHLCCNREMFIQFQPYEESIMLAGENKIQAVGRGIVHIKTNKTDITLKDVLYVPSIQCNFMSVAKAINNGYTVQFDDRSAMIKNKHGGIVVRAKKVSDLFILQTNNNKLFCARGNVEDAMKWHKRFGHLNFDSMRKLTNNQLVRGMHVNFPTEISCSVCMRSKCTQRPFQSSNNRATEILQIIHTDLCGPIPITSIGGAKYMLTFIDDKSRYVFVYFLRGKDEVLNTFKEFKSMVELQTEKRIKVLRSDNGTEYVNKDFDKFLKESGIVRQLTVPYTPQQNGVAERFNRTLIEMARCMLVESGMEESLWAEAVYTAAYLRNRAPTQALNNSTPFEVWHGCKPSVAHLKVFGSKTIALDKKQRGKFKPRGKEYYLVGYSDSSKAYRLYNAETKKLIISRDVYVIESKQSAGKDNALKYITAEIPEANNERREVSVTICEEPEMINEIPEIDDNLDDELYVSAEEEENVEEEPLMRGPGRPRIIRTGTRGRPRKEYNVLNLVIPEAPTTVNEALSSEYADEWRAAMQEEYKALIKNNTWQITSLPKGQKVVGNKWVFTVKRDKNGNVERFKARLVAKGCSQMYGVNYTDTYSPVARYETVRMIFAIAAEYSLYVHQMDVSTAYLNSDINDDIYMKQPQEYVDKNHPDHVLKLNKALYGLKQSGRQWNIKLDSILREIGFRPCDSEPCVYTKHHDGQLNIIIVYVDDLLIACTNKEEMFEIKALIAQQVQVVDKGAVQNFISIEVDREGETDAIAISQQNHIRKLMQEYNMECCRPVSIPLDPGHQVKCDKEGCKPIDQTQYQSLIGSLMYIAICTRPDILHSVCKLSQRNSDPHKEHFAAAKRILKYLCATVDKKLRYHKTGNDIEGFVDADWGSDTSDRKSYTGYVFRFAGAVISFESKKQSAVALSSTEAEYMALSSAVKEATYLKKFLKEMQLSCPKAMVINGDNLSAMNLVKNPVYHSRSKHIEIKYHHVRDVYKSGEIELKYCSTNEMVADVLTKNLPKVSHEKFTSMMGLY